MDSSQRNASDTSLDAPDTPSNPTMVERPISGGSSDADALSKPSVVSSQPDEKTVMATMMSLSRGGRSTYLRYGLAAAMTLVFGVAGVVALRASSAQSDIEQGNFAVTTIPLESLNANQVSGGSAPKLIVNGQLQVRDSLTLQPSAAPLKAVAGQLYFDKDLKTLRYYNGQGYTTLGGGITNIAGDTITNVTNIISNGGGSTVPTAVPDSVLLQAAAPGTQQAGNFNISGTGQVGVLRTTTISSGGGALSINPPGGTGQAMFSLSNTGQAVFQNTEDSDSAFQIQTAGNTNTIFNVDTANGRVSIGKASAAYMLDIAGGDINLSAGRSLRFAGQQALSVNGSGTTTSLSNSSSGGTVTAQADNFTVSDANGTHQNLAVDSNGAATFSNKTDTTAGFRVQNASGTNLITVDTLNGNVAVSGAGTGNVSVATAAGNTVTGNINLHTGDSSTTAAGDINIDAGTGIIDGTVVGTKTFESGTDNMVNWFNANVAQSAAQAHSGVSSLAMTATDPFWGIEENTNQPLTPVVAGHQYHFSYWVRAATTGRSLVSKIVWNGGAGGNVSLQTIVDSNTGWLEVTGNGQAPAGATGVYFQINSSGAAIGEVHYFDDFVVTDLSSATAASKINVGATNAKFVTIGNINQIGETAIYGGSGINLYAGVSNIGLSGGVLSLTGGAASNFTTTAGALTLNGAAGLNLMVNSTTIASLSTTSFTVNRNLILNNSHFTSTQTTAPTIGTPASCGTTPTAAVTAGSTDSAGSFTITTGTGGTSATCDTIISFNQAFAAAPKSIIVIGKTNAASAARQVYVSASTANNFTVSFGQSAAGANSTAYSFSYWVIE